MNLVKTNTWLFVELVVDSTQEPLVTVVLDTSVCIRVRGQAEQSLLINPMI